MNQQPFIPARVPPPGRILLRELEARSWTQQDLATIAGQSLQTIEAIVQAQQPITAELALALTKALGTSAEFWTNLETHYQQHQTRNISQVPERTEKSKIA